MVTAELAAALPVLVLLTLLAISAVSISAQRIRAYDAAREVARAIARGDPASAQQYLRSTSPSAVMSVKRSAADVAVETRIAVHPLGSWLPSITVTEHAVAATEPSVGENTASGHPAAFSSGRHTDGRQIAFSISRNTRGAPP